MGCEQQHGTRTQQYAGSDSASGPHPRCKIGKGRPQSADSANCTHLSLQGQNKLQELLSEFEELFDGTLGDWKMEHVSFELKEGTKPYNVRPFPVPQSCKETTNKELNRLCDLGVLEFQPASEWASPSLVIPIKENNVCFISDFREVNKRLVKKPFPIQKVSTVLQELE